MQRRRNFPLASNRPFPPGSSGRSDAFPSYGSRSSALLFCNANVVQMVLKQPPRMSVAAGAPKGEESNNKTEKKTQPFAHKLLHKVQTDIRTMGSVYVGTTASRMEGRKKWTNTQSDGRKERGREGWLGGGKSFHQCKCIIGALCALCGERCFPRHSGGEKNQQSAPEECTCIEREPITRSGCNELHTHFRTPTDQNRFDSKSIDSSPQKTANDDVRRMMLCENELATTMPKTSLAAGCAKLPKL